jgi:hypothetical protein
VNLAAELRSFDEPTGRFEVAAVTYGTVDSHGTRWLPGVFTDSLRRQMPTARFGHSENRARHIGTFHDWREDPDQLVLIGQLEPREKTPWVRRAWEGLRSRVLTDFSVVFTRKQARTAPDGVTEFVRADLHRVDLVLEGSVPGAQLLAFRGAQSLGPVAARHALAHRQVAQGLWTPKAPDVAARVALRAADEALENLGL